MSGESVLASIPSVSWPGAPCGYGVAINDGAGRWICVPESTPCPPGTVLYVSPPEPYVWRFCAPLENVSEAVLRFGPNQADALLAPPVPVPVFDLWAVAVVIAALSFVGSWRAR